jgi:dihydrodiol dehydrogenase / D-xylose 1-dehydrogenase (NADP)
VFGGEKPLKILSGGCLNAHGIDISSSTTLIYSRGRTATLLTHTKVDLPCEGLVIGTKGTLKLPNPFLCSTKLETPSGTLEFPLPQSDKKINFLNSTGLSYECEEVRRCIQSGRLESSIISHEESILISEIMETIRKQVGVVFDE